MIFVMIQAQHRRVGDIGLWVWVAQVDLTQPITYETHPRDVFVTHQMVSHIPINAGT